VLQAAEALVAGMKDGSIRSARRKPYRPSTTRSYERALGLGPELRERAPERVCERLGDLQLSELQRSDVQAYVDRLVAAGWDASTIGGELDPLRALLRRARQRDEIGTDPMANLDLPTPAGRTAPRAAA
jgi:site-specific recombinase XerD